MNITNITSASNSCIGCGICVAMCPSKHLVLKKNKLNQYSVFETDNKCNDSCSICMNVCPFSNNAENEDIVSSNLFDDSFKYDSITGKYINSYVGFHPDLEKRMNCASGGLVSYLLEYLLRHDDVDTAIVVGKHEGSYYSYYKCSNPDDVYKYSRSAYTVVSINETLSDIIRDDNIKSFAVVAVPCFSKALRNSIKYNVKLRKKLKYIIGLVCGQQKSNSFVEYLSSKFKIDVLSSIDFRTKKTGRNNGNYGVKLLDRTGVEKEITFSDYAKEWSFKMFSVPACSLCDDIFAETADIVFMDAWLPEYNTSDKGENLIITRNRHLDEIISNISTVKKIDVNKVKSSQSFVIKSKREAILTNIKKSNQKFKYTPIKRNDKLKKPNCLEQFLHSVKYDIALESDRLWIESRKDYNIFISVFNRKFKYRLFIGLVLYKISNIIKRLF